MGPRIRYSLAATAVTVALAAAVWIGRGVTREHEPQGVTEIKIQTEAAPPESTVSMPAPVASVAEAPQAQAPSNDDPRVREFEQRTQFQQEVRSFFAEVPMLPLAERTACARSIAQQITLYEAAGEMAAAEALTLRSALIRETVADPAEQVEAIQNSSCTKYASARSSRKWRRCPAFPTG